MTMLSKARVLVTALLSKALVCGALLAPLSLMSGAQAQFPFTLALDVNGPAGQASAELAASVQRAITDRVDPYRVADGMAQQMLSRMGRASSGGIDEQQAIQAIVNATTAPNAMSYQIPILQAFFGKLLATGDQRARSAAAAVLFVTPPTTADALQAAMPELFNSVIAELRGEGEPAPAAFGSSGEAPGTAISTQSLLNDSTSVILSLEQTGSDI